MIKIADTLLEWIDANINWSSGFTDFDIDVNKVTLTDVKKEQIVEDIIKISISKEKTKRSDKQRSELKKLINDYYDESWFEPKLIPKLEDKWIEKAVPRFENRPSAQGIAPSIKKARKRNIDTTKAEDIFKNKIKNMILKQISEAEYIELKDIRKVGKFASIIGYNAKAPDLKRFKSDYENSGYNTAVNNLTETIVNKNI